MADPAALMQAAEDQFMTALEHKCVDMGLDSSMVSKIRAKAKAKYSCFFCMGFKVVYRSREGRFANLDGRGNFDIVNCMACQGNDNHVKVADPSAYGGFLCKRGTRGEEWWEEQAKLACEHAMKAGLAKLG
jgi:hypothetical protein